MNIGSFYCCTLPLGNDDSMYGSRFMAAGFSGLVCAFNNYLGDIIRATRIRVGLL